MKNITEKYFTLLILLELFIDTLSHKKITLLDFSVPQR